MTPAEIRIECLKLAHRADREPEDILRRAREFEKYVVEQPAPNPFDEHKPAGRETLSLMGKAGNRKAG